MSFSMDDGSELSFISPNNKFSLEWVDLGEGLNGDFNPNDPNDRPLLRADLYEKFGSAWVAVDDGSYCTQAKVGTDPKILEKYSRELFQDLGDSFNRKVMQVWTWRVK